MKSPSKHIGRAATSVMNFRANFERKVSPVGSDNSKMPRWPWELKATVDGRNPAPVGNYWKTYWKMVI